MASTYLTRSKSSPTSDKIGTISFWMKKSSIAAEQCIIQSGGGTIDSNIFFDTSSRLNVYDYQSGAYQFRYVTNRVFRDSNAWYHIVVRIDTTDATAADRVKIYVNGVQETSFNTSTNPSQNLTPLFFTNSYNFWIGSYRSTGSFFDGSLSHFHYTDGYAYDASDFGSFDSTSGIWKINTSPSLNYGSNGFFILKDGNSVTDQSSNSNNFTVGGGSLTDTPDCPSNNFATFCNLTTYAGAGFMVHERANTRTGENSGVSYLNLLPNKGKWFVEYHINTAGAGQDNGVGFWSVMEAQTYAFYQTDFRGIVWKYAGNVYVDGVNNAFSSDTFTSGDIISIAMDFDNDRATFYKNGTVATNLNNYSYNFSNHFAVSTGVLDGASASAEDGIFDLNAGQNPTFGGRKTAGTNTDANGHGLFSMAVPSGYYAICTKNIKLYGG